jgi:hypothetical protein
MNPAMWEMMWFCLITAGDIRTRTMRYWYNGITSVFQTENTCPIQVYRTYYSYSRTKKD